MTRIATTLTCALFVLLGPTTLWAQEGTITGTVSDADTGDPLPGANVVITELGKGAATSPQGDYTIAEVPPGSYTLQVSFVGYESTERRVTIEAGETARHDFALEVDMSELEEVVVTGYGSTARAEDLSGSIASVSAGEIESRDLESPEEALQGKTPGVQVISESGQPGDGFSVKIRGTGSINAGTEPLYIVDGVPVNSGNNSQGLSASSALSSLNPEDIESISVLKDAAAASIYGSQAANGVVLITTKRGRQGDTRISASTSLGYRGVLNQIPVLDGPEFIELARESLLNGGFSESVTNGYLQDLYGVSTPSEAPTHAWQDAFQRNGLTQEYQVSARGGNEDTQFYLSGSYENIDGQIVFTNFKRGVFRANLDHSPAEDLKIKTSLNLSAATNDNVFGGGAFASPIRAGILIAPTSPIYNDDGSYNLDLPSNFNINPLQTSDYNQDEGLMKHAIGNLTVNYEIAPGLDFKSTYSLDYQEIDESTYIDPRTAWGREHGGMARRAFTDILNWSTDQVLSYEGTWAQKHDVSSTAGVTYRHEREKGLYTSAHQFPSPKFKTLNSAAEYEGSPSSYSTSYKLAGAFGRINYIYDDRYIVTLTGRYDGSSRFGSRNKWGFFPAASMAWRIGRESFMDGLAFVDQLKLRASVGVTGNNDIGNFQSRALFIGGPNYLGQAGLAPSSVGNPNLSWEEAVTYNAGLDFGAFDGRISGTVEYFVKNSNDLLLDRPLPSTTGYSEVTQNVGSVQNRGLELQVSTDNIRTNDFSWSTDFNISFVRNEVTKLYGGKDRISETIRVGHPLGIYFRNEYAGVNPADGRPMWYDSDGNLTYRMRPSDRKIIGNNQPDHYGGITNTLSYKGLELRAFFQWEMGLLRFDSDKRYAETMMAYPSGGSNWASILNRWQEPGDVTEYPMVVYAYQYPNGADPYARFASSALIENASYIRLKNLRLRYDLPGRLVQSLGVQEASLYVQGSNLWTLTEWDGYDPETDERYNWGQYPRGKTYGMGLNITM